MVNKIPHKFLPMALQKTFIEREYDEAKCVLKKDVLKCQISLNPSSLSKGYELEIIYKKGKSPRVYPKFKLKALKDKELPHIYKRNGESLCLYYPRYKEWTPNMKISETIVPWASEWLFHYEIWLATGKWNGGGIEHGSKEKK